MGRSRGSQRPRGASRVGAPHGREPLRVCRGVRRMSGATQRSLGRLARPLASGSRTGWAALAIGSALLLLGTAAWTARLGWFDAPYWVFVAWALALAALAALAFAAFRSDGTYSAMGLAQWLEQHGVWRAGSLSALLDSPAPGTSPALLSAADDIRAAEIDDR